MLMLKESKKRWFLVLFFIVVGILLFLNTMNFSEKQKASYESQIVWERNDSQDQKNRIESRCGAGEGPDLYLNGKRITENECELEFNPVVNNKGDFAYARFDGSTTVSSLVCNGEEIFAQGTLCQNLQMTEDYLVFSSLERSTNATEIYTFSLEKKMIEKVTSLPGQYVSEIKKIDKEKFVILSAPNARGGVQRIFSMQKTAV